MSDLVIPIERIENKIYLIRGQKVMLDFDLANLYEVPTKRMIEQVKRNKDRFPLDFMFQVSKDEFRILRSQFATSNWGGRRYLPYAFTEHGILMLSSVLNSKRAIQVNIQIMRAFVQLNRILTSHIEVSKKLKELEQKTIKNEKDIQLIFNVIRQLTEVKPPAIGFLRDRE